MTRATWLNAGGLTLLALTASALAYPALSTELPIHWDIHGHADGFGPRWLVAWLNPALMAAMVLLWAVLPAISPRNYRLDSQSPTYQRMLFVLLGLFGYIHAITLYAGLNPGSDVGRALLAGIFLAMGCLGNLLGKVKRNFFVGIRTPWTLASERVWIDTHRLAAWAFVAAGLVGFILVLVGLPVVAFATLIAAALGPVAYSLWLYKRLERQGLIP
jgi:uncharacterized membrane protein